MPAVEAGLHTGLVRKAFRGTVTEGTGGVPKTAVTSNYPVGTTWPTWYPCSLRTVRKHPYTSVF